MKTLAVDCSNSASLGMEQDDEAAFACLLPYRAKGIAVFVFAFAKSDREHIDPRELISLRAFGSRWLAADEAQIALGIREDEIQEITNGQEA